MSKRNITFSRPAEPTFLRKLKEEAGYKEGSTVDTKRENLNAVCPEDLEDTNEELPTVVVLKTGDLTAEEAEKYKQQLDKEESGKPADLSAPIVFKAPTKRRQADEESTTQSKRRKDKKQPRKQILSFSTDDEDVN